MILETIYSRSSKVSRSVHRLSNRYITLLLAEFNSVHLKGHQVSDGGDPEKYSCHSSGVKGRPTTSHASSRILLRFKGI